MNQIRIADSVSDLKNIKSPTEYHGYVYIVEYDDGKIKIGSTQNLYIRISKLESVCKNYMGAKIKSIAFTEPHTNFRANEKLMHGSFADKRIANGELFKVSYNEAIVKLADLDLLDESEEKRQHADETFTGLVGLLGFENFVQEKKKISSPQLKHPKEIRPIIDNRSINYVSGRELIDLLNSVEEREQPIDEGLSIDLDKTYLWITETLLIPVEDEGDERS